MSQDSGFGRKPPVRKTMIQQPVSRGLRQLGGIAIGVLLAFGIGAVYVYGMKAAGRALSTHWAENAGYPQLDQPPLTRVATAASTYNELRTACLARAKTVQMSNAMRQELDHYVNIWVGEEELMQHAAFIDCLMTELPARLCLADHRKHLADAVRAYFRLRVKVREEWMMARNSPFSAQAVGLVAMPGSQGISTRYPSERTDPRIVSGLRTLIADGHLTHSDLSGGGLFGQMPGDLGERLKGVERQKRSCG